MEFNISRGQVMRSKALLGTVWIVGALSGAIAAYGKKDAPDARPFSQQLSGDQKIEQALSRLTFGARAGDADGIRKIGLKKWMDRQLHPESIAENPVLEEKLKHLDILRISKS